MNPFHLDATGLMIWGLVVHLIADWPLQSDWMANNKMKRRQRTLRRGDGMMTPPRMYQPEDRWWDRHPAAYVHAGIHGIALAYVFGWVAAPLAVVHLIIDMRWPVVKWSKFVGQTQPEDWTAPLVDIGTEVRFWTDQVFHIICIAIAALLIG